MSAAVQTIPKLADAAKAGRSDGIAPLDLDSLVVTPKALGLGNTLGSQTARSAAGPTPHASTYFRTTLLPDGRLISKFHVAGTDGPTPRQDDYMTQSQHPAMSTSRLDFVERSYLRPEERPSTTRYGQAQSAWATAKLRHREVGIVPSAKGRTLPFYRDRHPRPASTPAAISVWQRDAPEAEPASPPPIAHIGAPVLPPVPEAPPASDLAADVRALVTSADPEGLVTAWMQSASLFEREVARRFLKEIAVRAGRRK